jgi:exonuclease III
VPTSEYEDDEVEELYDIIEEILEEVGKGVTNMIIMGDWNSVIGNKAHHNTVGPYGLGRRNQRGQMLIDFCERNGLVITNTWFKKPKRRLYTWKSPGDRSRYQLDYVLVKQRFTNSVKDVQTMPGADIDFAHNSLVAKICTSLKKIIRFHKQKPRWDLEKLYDQRQEIHDSL